MIQRVPMKNSLYAIVVVSAAAWFLLAFFEGLDLSHAQDFFGLIPKVVTVDALLIVVFVKWGWRLRLFQRWLVPFPDLNGTWLGQIVSDWVDPTTDSKLPSIPTMLTIRQSFLHVSCVVSTAEMKSHSYSEGFRVDPDRQLKQIAYSYTSTPRTLVSERSRPHEGTALFDIIDKPSRKLVGKYWTDRKTTGEMVFEFYGPELLEELPGDVSARHPLSGRRER